jgi:hypothetical protein
MRYAHEVSSENLKEICNLGYLDVDVEIILKKKA